MTEGIVQSPSSSVAGTTSPTISPELNNRLARVVKEVMIPEIESQIERLNDLTNTRGQFAQRVQQIYATKNGCIYGKAIPDKNRFNDGNKE